jgi:HK97 gp10 family phage protein
MIDPAVFAARLRAPLSEEEWKKEWSQRVADEMRSFAPVDTGELRASIRVTGDGVEVGASYGVYVEFGTSDTAPQPFVAPAVNRAIKPAAADAGKRVLKQLT